MTVTHPPGEPGIEPQLSAAVLRYAALLAGNRDDAEDLVQEATVRLLEERAAGREVTYAAAFLRRVVTNAFISGRRRHSLWRRTMPRLAPTTVAVRGMEEGVADRARLSRALLHLPVRQRAAVVLRYYEDLAYAEIGAALDCSEPTARSLVNRGLRALRLTIEGDE